MFGRSPLTAAATSWYQGAKGEIAVGTLLTNLPPEWTVLHALPVGARGSDIDHIVVGPGGVFTINTKHHRDKKVWVAKDTLLVDGAKKNYVRDAEFEARRVGKLIEKRMPLPAPVQPILTFVSPSQLMIREKPVQVKVLEAWQLNRWLTNLSHVFTEPEQDEITSILEDPTTWAGMTDAGVEPPVALTAVERVWTGDSALIPEDPDEAELAGSEVSIGLMAAFERLDAEVRSARARRAGWNIVGYALLVIAPVSALWMLSDMLTGAGGL